MLPPTKFFFMKSSFEFFTTICALIFFFGCPKVNNCSGNWPYSYICSLIASCLILLLVFSCSKVSL